mgnify:CR=1 FL=1
MLNENKKLWFCWCHTSEHHFNRVFEEVHGKHHSGYVNEKWQKFSKNPLSLWAFPDGEGTLLEALIKDYEYRRDNKLSHIM